MKEWLPLQWPDGYTPSLWVSPQHKAAHILNAVTRMKRRYNLSSLKTGESSMRKTCSSRWIWNEWRSKTRLSPCCAYFRWCWVPLTLRSRKNVIRGGSSSHSVIRQISSRGTAQRNLWSKIVSACTSTNICIRYLENSGTIFPNANRAQFSLW